MELDNFAPEGEQIGQVIEQACSQGFEADKGRAPKNTNELRDWMRAGGSQVLNEVAPLAFAVEPLPGADLDSADTYLAPAVQISPVVNPLFHALMVKLGATPNGPRTYEISAGKGNNANDFAAIVKNLTAILKVIPSEVCYDPSCVEQGEKKGFQSWNSSRFSVMRNIYCLIHNTTAGQEVERSVIRPMTAAHPEEGNLAGAAVIINSAKGRIFVKVCSNRSTPNGLLFSDEDGTPDLDRLRPGGRLDPQVTTPDRAVALMEAAEAEGYTVLDPHGHLAKMRDKLAGMVVAQRVPGSPGQGRLIVGGQVSAKLGPADKRLPKEGAVRVAAVPAAAAGEAVAKAGKAGAKVALAAEVADVIAMAEAKPVAQDSDDSPVSLRDYQREAVGLHVATSIGYLQACSVGLGKTAITLRGMREAAQAK